MSTPVILTDPIITFDLVTGGTPAGTPVDVSCHVRAIQVEVDVPETDVSTFCNPGGTAAGAPAYTLGIDWIIHTDTEAELAQFVGSDVLVTVTPNSSLGKNLTLTAAFGPVNPAHIGELTAGEAWESSTSHAVAKSGAPSWTNPV